MDTTRVKEFYITDNEPTFFFFKRVKKMRLPNFKKTFIFTLFFLLIANSTYCFAANPLVIGVFPRRSVQETITMFKPLGEKLQSELGIPVRVSSSKDFPTFWKTLKAGKFDIVHFSQYHFLLAKNDLNFKGLVQNEEGGRSSMYSAIYVRKDSGIKTIKV